MICHYVSKLSRDLTQRMHTPTTASIEAIDISNVKTTPEGDGGETINIVNKSDVIAAEGEDEDDFEYASPSVGIVFGRERYGLTNEELALADSTIYIPANEHYSVLNLAQAVNIIGYELFQRQLELKNEFRTGGVLSIRTCDRLANREELDMFLSRLKENLLSRNYKPVSKNNNEIKDMQKVERYNDLIIEGGEQSPELAENILAAAKTVDVKVEKIGEIENVEKTEIIKSKK